MRMVILGFILLLAVRDRKSTRLNSSHTVIYTLSLHDALPISLQGVPQEDEFAGVDRSRGERYADGYPGVYFTFGRERSEEHTSELQSHRDLHSFPTRRSSDLASRRSSRR